MIFRLGVMSGLGGAIMVSPVLMRSIQPNGPKLRAYCLTGKRLKERAK